MKRVGLVGWRGMVGSVLMQRMREEGDFSHIEPVFFTTSNVGGAAPDFGKAAPALLDARSIEALKAMDIVITCQGAITPTRSIRNCAEPAGPATGSTRLRPCA